MIEGLRRTALLEREFPRGGIAPTETVAFQIYFSILPILCR